MKIYKALVVLVGIVIVSILIVNSSKWAHSLQDFYVQSTKKYGIVGSIWEKTWIFYLFKIGVILSGIVVVALLLILFR